NNLAQRNISILSAALDSLVLFPFVAGHRRDRADFLELVIDRSNLPQNFQLHLNPRERASFFPGVEAASSPTGCSARLLDPMRVAVSWQDVEAVLRLPA